ncbi:exopolyphosphatase [Metabacillus herbersteinensis]|uniref:exopolyphosphatase n=1 Tax=Metabacillus herbersteinensis TaxID=283816 RepID=A0ABV6GCM1_9BACI
MTKDKYAIIDIGSNTMRLVIFQRDKSGRLKEIENVKAVARLRNYLTEGSILTKDGIRILLTTLHSFQGVTRHHQLKEVKCVATATIRQAANQKEIINLVTEETDFTIRLLSEYEEAYFGFLAVVNSTSIDDGITIDIGGGSTEITYFKDRKLINYHSFPFGSLSLKKQFVTREVPSEEELEKLRIFLKGEFQSLTWLKNKQLPIVAIGGSARNMVQIDQSLKAYPLAGVHQYKMKLEDIEEVKRHLIELTFSDLQKVEGLSRDRADIIIPAVEVFQSLYEHVDANQFILSKKGLRDGVFYEELTRDFGLSIFPNVIEESFYELATDYDINLNHVFQVTNIASAIFQHLKEAEIYSLTNEDLIILKRGAFVYNLGQYIDSDSSSQHTFYLIANRTIDGLLHPDRLKIALVVSYKSKESFKQYLDPYQDWFTKEVQKKLRLLGALIKFSYSLNATKRNIVKHIEFEDVQSGLIFHISCSKDWQPEYYQVEKQKKHLEKIVKRTITVKFKYVEN